MEEDEEGPLAAEVCDEEVKETVDDKCLQRDLSVKRDCMRWSGL